MTYTPTAYAKRFDGKHYIFLTTPSGVVVRLLSAYVTQEGAETAIDRLGFKKIEPPKITFTTLNRGNTTPR